MISRSRRNPRTTGSKSNENNKIITPSARSDGVFIAPTSSIPPSRMLRIQILPLFKPRRSGSDVDVITFFYIVVYSSRICFTMQMKIPYSDARFRLNRHGSLVLSNSHRILPQQMAMHPFFSISGFLNRVSFRSVKPEPLRRTYVLMTEENERRVK